MLPAGAPAWRRKSGSGRAPDRAGVGMFLAPLVSRFTTVLTVEPEPASFVHDGWNLFPQSL